MVVKRHVFIGDGMDRNLGSTTALILFAPAIFTYDHSSLIIFVKNDAMLSSSTSNDDELVLLSVANVVIPNIDDRYEVRGLLGVLPLLPLLLEEVPNDDTNCFLFGFLDVDDETKSRTTSAVSSSS